MRGHRKAGHHSQVYDEDLDEDVVITLTAKNPQESAIPFNVFARDWLMSAVDEFVRNN